jgi:hypothetical protein
MLDGTDLMHHISTFNLNADAITRFCGGAKAIAKLGLEFRLGVKLRVHLADLLRRDLPRPKAQSKILLTLLYWSTRIELAFNGA